MSEGTNKEILLIDGMTCVNCEKKIEKTLKNIRGIESIKANYSKSSVEIVYFKDSISLTMIKQIIEEIDYRIIDEDVNNSDKTKNKYVEFAGLVIIILSLYIIINRIGGFAIFNYFPEAREGTGYGVLFVIGLMTSIHCVAMCGGINLSQNVSLQFINKSKKNKLSSIKPSILYNLGRVVSYTFIGAIVGSLGLIISFSGKAQGIVTIIAGVFMMIMGINMLNIFPFLRKFTVRLPRIISKKENNNGQFFVGLLNGLMPCGPLQTMQIYALSTGSPIRGALAMFFFSIGTVPLMFGMGAISSIISYKFKKNITSVSAALVVVLGFVMFNNGMSLSGVNILSEKKGISDTSVAQVSGKVQTITTKLSSGGYEPITVQKGIPVKWIIQADDKDINGCNNKIIIQKFNVQKKLVPGDNIIEFTPLESGTISYSCWMGMIRSSITIVDKL